MKTDSPIIEIMFNNLEFSDDETQFIIKRFNKMSIAKGDVILHAGETVNHQYYVESGCLRSYFIDDQGKEHTLQFAINDWWTSDYMAFFTSEKSRLHLDCIRDAIVYRITRDAIEEIYDHIPKVERFFRKKLEQAFVSFQRRILLNLSHSAKTRYLFFLQQYPNIEKEIKNYHIASFLGITTESLSRIRKEIAEN